MGYYAKIALNCTLNRNILDRYKDHRRRNPQDGIHANLSPTLPDILGL